MSQKPFLLRYKKEKHLKTMTCKQLGGACDKKFQANSFEEIAEMSRQHGMEMFQKGDEEHLRAMDKIKGLMQNPDAMKEWFENKKKEFEALPED
jgi:preprotein translocase subunit SecA